MRSKRKKRPRTEGKRGIYVLPSLFTSASLFGGFYAIIASLKGEYEIAAIAILISCLCDILDGKIARFTHTESRFGAEYDSLSDLVAFGVAPGVLAYQWALEPFGRLGWLASFMYVICGALRLARFNVQKDSLKINYFKGLPIPAAASFIAALILFTTAFGEDIEGARHILIIIPIYILSFLMVSSIKYPSFKDFELKKQRPFNMLVGIILILIVIAYRPRIMLFFMMILYILSGPALTIYQVRKRQVLTKDSLRDISPAEESDSV
jgi:CDP-diacylglycerol--serine O-phosphatidyltransferase